jgi:hypothetical protein
MSVPLACDILSLIEIIGSNCGGGLLGIPADDRLMTPIAL